MAFYMTESSDWKERSMTQEEKNELMMQKLMRA